MAKALATRQPWAELIASGQKTVEYRSWMTRYRGPLVIIASSSLHADAHDHYDEPERLPRSCLVALVDLVDIKGHEGDYEWHLRNPRRLEPVPFTRSRVMTFDIDDALVKLANMKSPKRAIAAKRAMRPKRNADDVRVDWPKGLRIVPHPALKVGRSRGE